MLVTVSNFDKILFCCAPEFFDVAVTTHWCSCPGLAENVRNIARYTAFCHSSSSSQNSYYHWPRYDMYHYPAASVFRCARKPPDRHASRFLEVLDQGQPCNCSALHQCISICPKLAALLTLQWTDAPEESACVIWTMLSLIGTGCLLIATVQHSNVDINPCLPAADFVYMQTLDCKPGCKSRLHPCLMLLVPQSCRHSPYLANRYIHILTEVLAATDHLVPYIHE